nr:sulfatase-like hydrolase/transferase [Chitinophagaceae bacterium]
MKKTIPFLMLLGLGGGFISCQTAAPDKSEEKADARPNVLIIVADDLGYSDVAPFGGNISTPALDALSKESIRFSNFHVLPTCSPTRSALLTGNDNHVTGLGVMEETLYPALVQQQLPGYAGH